MAIPDYQTLMLPVLNLAADGAEHKFRDAVDKLADEFSLSDEERNELLPSGSQAVFTNRVGWARSYLKQAGLLASPRRGYFTITEQGRSLLAEMPEKVNVAVLEKYPAFLEFRARRRDKSNDSKTPTIETTVSTDTPEDALASAYRTLRRNLEQELLDAVTEFSPTFFERIVVDLLVKMGYRYGYMPIVTIKGWTMCFSNPSWGANPMTQ